jgi:predicted TIM-barrel fold metal-dependent hydrolase
VPAIAGGDFAHWAARITELGRRPNLHAKLSGITAYGPADWTAETLRPYVQHVIASFGPGRVVWGSDSPVCTLQSSLPEWVAVTHLLLADLTKEERAAILHGNARRLWLG